LNLHTSDDPAAVGQGGIVTGDPVVAVNAITRDGRTKPKTTGRDVEDVQVGDVLDIHNQFRLQAVIANVIDQIGSAGQGTGSTTVTAE